MATIRGGRRNDSIIGTEADDLLDGAAGSDVLQGLGGNDQLIGGSGADILTGGTGSDTFAYIASAEVSRRGVTLTSDSSATAFDVITDFESGTDKIDLRGVKSLEPLVWSEQIPTAFGVWYARDGNSTIIFVDIDGVIADPQGNLVPADLVIRLDGQVDLTASDFLGLSDLSTPVITSNGGGDAAAVSVAENETAVTTVVATDRDSAALTYSIGGGADAGLFTIDAVTGALSFISAPDFENPADADGNNIYNVVVTASDGEHVDSQSLTVTVTDVRGAAPIIRSDGGRDTAFISVAENVTVVTTVMATDRDSASLSYSISGGADAGLFTINAVTGALSFISAPDFENPGSAAGTNVYDVSVTVSDGEAKDSQTLVVTVTNVADAINNAPVITSNGAGDTATVNVVEGLAEVTTVTATDVDSPTLTYAISGGADASLFAIDAITGTVRFISTPDYERFGSAAGTSVYAVEVIVSDGENLDSQALTVAVTNVNDNAPVITNSGGADTAEAEVSENTTAVTTVTASDPDGASPTHAGLTYSISGGADAGLFVIEPVTGALSFISAPDFENPASAAGTNVYDVIVTVSDDENSDSQTIAVTVTDVNDNASVITSNGGGADAAVDVAESGATVTTVTATDADSANLQYSISRGADAGLFMIDAATGVLSFISAPDFEHPVSAAGTNIYAVEVTVSDGANSDSQAIAVTVTDVNDNTPVITSNGGGDTAVVEVAEGVSVVTIVTATDADSARLTHSISGGEDAGLFALDATTGALSFISAPDFENPVDANGDNIYDVVVTVGDGENLDIQALAVTVNDVDENRPSVVITNDRAGPATVADGGIVYTFTFSEAVSGFSIDDITVTHGSKESDSFTVISASVYTLTVMPNPDFEGDLIVDVAENVAFDAGGNGNAAASSNVQPVDTLAPVFTTGGQTSAIVNIAIDESIGDGQVIYDADATGARSFSLMPGDDAAAFSISDSTGVVTLIANPNFEVQASYRFAVVATDALGNTSQQVVNLSINDINEAPSVDPQAFNLDENSANGTVVGTVLASDPDTATPNNTLIYAIVGGNVGGAFTIDPGTGDISVANYEVLDYETQPTFSLTVQVSDAGSPSLSATADFTVTLSDLDDDAPSAKIDLSLLDGNDGFQITGAMAGDRVGGSVSNAGDFNGDGYDDVIIGTRYADPNGTNSGESYVVFGTSTSVGVNLSLTVLDGSNGFRISGAAGGHLSGYSVSTAGDINGDGYDDLVIGATGVAQNGTSSGASYVVFGVSTGIGSSLQLSSLDGSNGFMLFGELAGDRLGFSVSSAGDLNSDGYDDLIVGARTADANGRVNSGASYVVFGHAGAFNANFELSSLDGGNGFQLSGGVLGDYAGASVSAAGDVNGDGYADIIVGATRADPNGSNSGASYVIFGGPNGFAANLDLASVDGLNGFKISGVVGNDFSGYSVSTAGDINGDGFGDLVVGAIGNGSAFTGNAYVVFGRGSFDANIQLSALEGPDGFRLSGVVGGDRAGVSVSTAGDVNGDGYDDLIIGADSAELGVANSGVSYLVFGSAAAFPANLNLSALDGVSGFAITGEFTNGQTGRSVSSAGDVNGDGYDDLIIGSPTANANGLTSGASHIVFGRDYRNTLIVGSADSEILALIDGEVGLDGAVGNDILSGNVADNSLIGGLGDDRLDGAAGNDVLIGGAGNDLLIYDVADQLRVDGGNGRDTLLLEGADSNLNLAALYGSHRSIEIVDLSGAGNHTLMLNVQDILHLTEAANGSDAGRDQNLLRVDGGAGDAVGTTTGIWVDLGAADQDGNLSEGGGYTLYHSGAAQLLVHNDVDRSGIVTVVPQILTSELDGSNGFRIDGAVEGARGGYSVSGIGDINGDGYEDVAVGAPRFPNSELLGQTYVVFGQQGGFPASLGGSDLNGSNGFRISSGIPGDQLGHSVSGAGDFNGDGYDELIVGAPGSSLSYLLFGSASGFGSELHLSDIDGSNGFRIVGTANYQAGISVAAAGDVNGDGLDDLIIGDDRYNSGGGASFVVFGRTEGFGSELDLSYGNLNGESGFSIYQFGSDISGLGFSVSSIGDFNGDGFDDVVVGAPRTLSYGDRYSGESFVIFGGARDFGDSAIKLEELNGSNGFRLTRAEGQESGHSVSSAGDINGDGLDDLIISAHLADPNGNYSGISYVLFGQKDSPSIVNIAFGAGSYGFQILGAAIYDRAGESVSSAGDVNGDGYDDLIVGAYGADPTGSNSGAAYVVYGRDGGFGATLDLASIDGANGFVIWGAAEGDFLGQSVSSAGDVNGDGYDDLIVGASSADGGAPGSGAGYVIFGGNFSIGQVLAGTDQADVLTGTEADERLVGGNGNDVIDGGGGRDVLIGGAGNDTFFFTREHVIVSSETFLRVDGGAGRDTLRVENYLDLHELNNFSSDTQNPENPFQSIEIIRLDAGGFLKLSAADLLHLVGAAGPQADRQQNLLRVDGEGFVNASLDAWTNMGPADSNGYLSASGTYTLFQAGEANLLISNGINHGNVRLAIPLVELQALNGEDGVQLSGFAPGSRAGFSVSSAGDVNGDGFDDVIVGAPGYRDRYDAFDRGAAYIVFGHADGFDPVLQLQSLNGSNGFMVTGQLGSYDQVGFSVSSAGDINGDGFDDLMVAAPSEERYTGVVYVLYGREDGFSSRLDLSTLYRGDDRLAFAVSGGQYFGESVSNVGDVNGDGFDDVVMAESRFSENAGMVFVVYGQSSESPEAFNTVAPTLIDGTNGFHIAPDYVDPESLGRSVSGAGDVNGDGYDDVIVGAPTSDDNGSAAGTSYVVFGGPGGAAAVFVDQLDGSNGFRLDGEPGDLSGRSVSAAGDVNGDGFGDLIIGAPLADPNGLSSGVAYVVFGGADGFGGALDLANLNGTSGFGAQGFRIIGQAQNDLTGFSVSDAGDFNGDGFDDLVVGAYKSDENGNRYVGSTYVLFGGAGFAPEFDLATLDGENGFQLIGEAGFDSAGRSVSAAGDVDGDGYADLLIGAPGNDADNSDSGAAYVIFGRETSFDFGQRIIGTAGNDVLGAFDEARGRDDVIIAGNGNDLLIYDPADSITVDGGAGVDTLRLQYGDSLDLTALNGFLSNNPQNPLSGIERIDASHDEAANTIVMALADLLEMSDSTNVIEVLGGSNDRIFIEGFTDSGIDMQSGGRDFDVYIAAGTNAELWIQQGMAVI